MIFCWLLSCCLITAQGQNITGAEYFIDSDPGAGNGIAINTGAAGANVNFTAAIVTTGLPSGFHFAGIRVKDGGLWGLTELRGFYISATVSNVTDISAAEYFIDTDPGAGNGTPIAISSGQDVSFSVPVPTNALSNGFHFLAIRTRNASGQWGLLEVRGFYISTATADAGAITAAEFFIDNDPGPGNGNSLSVGSSGTTVSFTASVPTNSLTQGFHFLSIRVRDAAGNWGLFENRGFYISAAASNVTDITAAEYFIDTDPGPGNANAIAVPAGQDVNFIASVPTASLSTGFHFLAIRTRDASGKWGLMENRGFYISPTTTNMANVTGGEFFLDADPGIGNGIPFSFTNAGQNVNEIISVQIPAGTSSGPHLLAARVRDANGIWGLFDTVRTLNVTASNLPLDFLSFTGRRDGSEVDLNWVTENEVNTSHFEVERSVNGIAFTKIGEVSSLNISGRHNYAFTDAQPFKGVNFYRLKQVDRDGRFKYSVVIKVYIGDQNNDLRLFPLPASTYLNIAFGGNGTTCYIQVYDANGKQVMNERRAKDAVMKMDIAQLANGSYWVVVWDGVVQQKGQFIKQ